jgi:hypothetical protein
MGLKLEYNAVLRPCQEESLCAQRPTALMPAPARQHGGAQSRRSAAEHRGHPGRSASHVRGVWIGSVGTSRSLALGGKPRSDLSAGRARGGAWPSCSLATTKKRAILDLRLTHYSGSSTIRVVLPVRSPLRRPSLHGRLALGRSRCVGGAPAARGCEPPEECGIVVLARHGRACRARPSSGGPPCQTVRRARWRSWGAVTRPAATGTRRRASSLRSARPSSSGRGSATHSCPQR